MPNEYKQDKGWVWRSLEYVLPINALASKPDSFMQIWCLGAIVIITMIRNYGATQSIVTTDEVDGE
jgi:hypothetical protein